MRRWSATALAALVALAAGCVSSPQVIHRTALQRAVFDLGCPEGSLIASQLGNTTALGRSSASYGVERTVVGVTGCGQKAVYVVECGQANVCNAQLNADTKPVAADPAPATAAP